MADSSGQVLTPLRAREFFSRPWSGRGEFVPSLLGARGARRFRFRSECEFLSDDEWIVHDTMEFDDGKASVRTMRARLVVPERIEVTADDMPGGTELQLEERGFRFRPYVLKVPLGPLRIRIHCRDRCWLDDDGVLHDEIDLRFLALPVGRITMELTAR
jgi:uncharacterized protein DUF3833